LIPYPLFKTLATVSSSTSLSIGLVQYSLAPSLKLSWVVATVG